MKFSLRLLTAILVLAIPILSVGWYVAADAPVDPKGTKKTIELSTGLSTREIARELKSEGLIRSELAFLILAKVRGGFLKAGVYELSPAEAASEIFQMIADGRVTENLVTIPEGWRLTEIAERVAGSVRNKDGIFLKKSDFLKAAEGFEGYLFPDTYRFPLNVTAEEIVQEMRENFGMRTKAITLKRADIILASIVEREAKNDDERGKIAAVYLNRLKNNMRLEADPTVQFAKTLVDSSISEPWPKITVDDYRSVNSPYNTYLNDGLPPGPICNPGLASLNAVLSPAPIDDLYFFHTSDGQLILSKTLDEHNTKKGQYNLAN